jgi:hypothetical protein
MAIQSVIVGHSPRTGIARIAVIAGQADLVLFERGQVKAGELFEIHGDVSLGRGGTRRAMMRS